MTEISLQTVEIYMVKGDDGRRTTNGRTDDGGPLSYKLPWSLRSRWDTTIKTYQEMTLVKCEERLASITLHYEVANMAAIFMFIF